MALFLQFQIGDDGYVLEATQVVRVLPLVAIKRIPHAPTGVAGAINYHGTAVPVVDLSQIALGRPAPTHLSTRVILVPIRIGADTPGGDSKRLLGVIAEKVTQTIQRDPAEFGPAGVTTDAARYLGPVAGDGSRLLQWINVQELLPVEISAALFRELEASA
jgi:chemotaxis-related protein WspB